MLRSESDNIPLGILLVLLCCLLAPLADAFAKLAAPLVTITTIVLVRFAFQAAMLLPLRVKEMRQINWSRRTRRLVLLRTIFQIGTGMFMVASVAVLPLAETLAIAFVLPFFLLTSGRLILKEDASIAQFIACCVGFAGTLMVIQPNFINIGWKALLPLSVALNLTGYLVLTRVLTEKIDAMTLHGMTGAIGFIFILIPGLFLVPDLFVIPQDAWLLLIGTGVMGTLARLAMTYSMSKAPTSTLAPLKYLEIPMATLLGYLIFSDIPQGTAAIGITLIFSAGLAIILHTHYASSSASQ